MQRLVKKVGTLERLTKISEHVQNFCIYAGHIRNECPSLLKKKLKVLPDAKLHQTWFATKSRLAAAALRNGY